MAGDPMTPAAVLDVKPRAAATEPAATIAFPALQRIRLAEPFEQLRDASDRMLTKSGRRPKVFLANLGTHVVDFAAWLMGSPVTEVACR